MKSALTRVACGALLAALVSACGGTPTDSPARGGTSARASAKPTGQGDICALLTAGDIQAVIGTPPGQPVAEGHRCEWPSADGSKQSLVSVIVVGTTFRSYEDYAATYRQQMNADPATSVHRIEGLGSFAIGFNDVPMVQVYSGSSMVQVATFGNQEKHALELAKKVVARVK